ncbi:MAG TPA: hypothetical protein VF517_10000 [Thermoleophilaceae bacterium]|jgi:hypothetical protein
MASRKEEKERLRQEREERERQEEEKSKKKKRRARMLGAAALLVLALAIIAFVAFSGSDKKSPEEAQKGLQATTGPWEPLTAGLEDRENALGLPAPSDTIYHVHAQLKVFVNGKPMTVPNNIGIDPAKGPVSLHTHDDKGIIHMEAVEPFPFTLGEFFTIWGVRFTPTTLGAFQAGNGLVLETYLNGKKVPNGPGLQMKQSDRVVVMFGKPNSAPKDFKLDAGASG